MHTLRLLALVLALATALPARAATDYTDIWWAAGGVESGWGLNLAQNANSIFMTFYLYNPSGAPTWYTAFLTRTVGETFAGDMFASSGGAWFGSPTWVLPTTASVGRVAFVATSPYSGTLTYTIDTVTVNKTIERATLVGINVAGVYLGAVTARRDGCGPTTIFEPNDQFVVTQSGTPGTIRVDSLSASDGSLTCRMEGTGVQYGGLIDVPDAEYTCNGGLSTRAHIIGLRPTATGFEGRWFTDFGQGCTETGNMAGATQVP